MTSFNHYALGAICDWLYSAVAGIRPAAPGFSRVRVQSTPGPGLDWVKAARETPSGRIAVDWTTDVETFHLVVDVPEGLATEVVLPDGTRHPIDGGRRSFTCARG